MANKVKYGLKNVYYSIATISSVDHSATYGTPVAIPGAVNLSLSAEGSMDPFRADNIDYYVSSSNNGYNGSLEVAMFPDAFRTDILGEVLDTDDVLIEKRETSAVHFALLFQFEGDSKAIRHVFYNCTAARPTVESSTTEASITPQTESVDISCTSIYNATLTSEIVKGRTTDNTDATEYTNWFTAVHQP